MDYVKRWHYDGLGKHMELGWTMKKGGTSMDYVKMWH